MKIGVISDTHIYNRSRLLPVKVFETFSNVDLIIHAGDIMIEEVLIELGVLAPVVVVAGNNDGYELNSKYGKKRVLELSGKKIGITHGYGHSRAFLNAYAAFVDEGMDCIVFGHSHAPYNEIVDGILFFNPGSPTDKRRQRQYSLGILHVPDDGIGDITGEIIYFD